MNTKKHYELINNAFEHGIFSTFDPIGRYVSKRKENYKTIYEEFIEEGINLTNEEQDINPKSLEYKILKGIGAAYGIVSQLIYLGAPQWLSLYVNSGTFEDRKRETKDSMPRQKLEKGIKLGRWIKRAGKCVFTTSLSIYIISRGLLEVNDHIDSQMIDNICEYIPDPSLFFSYIGGVIGGGYLLMGKYFEEDTKKELRELGEIIETRKD